MATNNLIRKEIASYLKDIKKALVCKNPKTKKMLTDFKESVFSYCEETPDTTIDDIKRHFGEPAMVAEEFTVGYGDDTYIKKYQFNKNCKVAIIAILAAILLFAATLNAMVAYHYHNAKGSYMEIEITYEEADK